MEEDYSNSNQQNFFLKSIIDKSEHVVFFALDRKYRYIIFNKNHFQTMKHIWGCDISIGQSMLEYIQDPTDRAKAQANFDRAFADESFKLIEDYGSTDLDRRFYDIVYNPVKDENNTILGVSVILTDTTEERKAKEALEINEAKLKETNAVKDKFFNIIAHDLRNPFNAILGLSELLLVKHKSYDNDKREEIIDAIHSSSQMVYYLIENLLEWSRTQTNKIIYNPDNYFLENLISEAISQTQLAATRKEIELSIKLDKKITVFVDKNMIETVLRNLISNAIKFTNRNGKIIISAIEDAGQITVSVKDNGIGMDSDMSNNLFEIKQIKGSSGTEQEKGTGLGLLLCKEFIEKHGGKIWVESEPGKGSEFSFSIPVGKD